MNGPYLIAASDHLVFMTNHPVWMSLLALAAVAFGAWSYRAQGAAPRYKWTLAGLRAAVLLTVALLLMEPALVSHQLVRQRGRVVIWVDSSLSMTLRDEYPPKEAAKLHDILLASHQSHPTRFQMAVTMLQQAQKGWLGALLKRQKVVIYTGGSRARLLGAAENQKQLDALLAELGKIKPAASSTDIPTIVSQVMGQLSGQPVSALMILSDGRDTHRTSSRAMASELKRRAVRLITVPIGRDHLPFSIELAQGSTPHQAFVGDPVPVSAKIITSENPGVLVRHVRLYEVGADGRVLLTRKKILIPAGKSEIPLRLTWRPKAPGRYHLQLVIRKAHGEFSPPVPGWKRHELSLTTRAVKAKIKILYVDGYPRWEYRYLKNDLAREKTTLLSCLLLSADNHFAQAGNIPIRRFPETQSELDQYDVLILGDVDPDYFSQRQMKLITHFVGNHGGGFLMIAGPQFSPGAYRGTPIAKLLPIIIGNPASPEMAPVEGIPFGLHLTTAGRRSMLFHFFNNEAANLREVANLPPLYWYQPVGGLSPSATALAMVAGRQISARDIPAIVMGRYGAGRTIFSAIADTWRWRTYHGAPIYKSYWLEMMRTLARSRLFQRRRAVAMQAAGRHVLVGQSVPVTVRINRISLLSSLPHELQMTIKGPGGHMQALLQAEPDNPGVFRTLVHIWAAGQYAFALKPGQLPVNSPALQLSAQTPETEFVNPRADLPAMAHWAATAEGKMLRPATFNQAGAYIPDRSVENLLIHSHQIWNKPWALALLVILLTVEWLLRKRAGLI